MNKKIGVITILSFLLVIVILYLSTGGKISGVMINNYTVSKDGNVMTINVGLASSIGYIRTLKESEDGNKKYITFYSTYGFNSKIGAKDKYQVVLQPSCDEIYFYSGDEYKLKLKKNSDTKKWERVKLSKVINNNNGCAFE